MTEDDQELEQGRDNGAVEQAEREEHPRDRKAGKDLKSIIRAAADEHRGRSYDDDGNELKKERREAKPAKDRQRDETGKFAPGSKAGEKRAEAEAAKSADPAPSKEIPSKDVNEEAKAASADKPKATTAPPDALSKEIKAIWDTLPDGVRNEFLRRENDTQKGVEQLKARYRAYDDAFTPVRDELSALGKTEAEGIKMLVDWRMALRGPNKVAAFKALAQSEGINLASLAGPAPTQNAPQNQGSPQAPQFDPNALRPMLDPVLQKVTSLESELQRRDQERVQNEIAAMSRDKPHFDKVRVAMGHLINDGLIQGDNPKEVFDKAYEAACRALPEVFALIQQEEQAKREEEARKAQEEAAKKAAEAEAERKRKEREEVEKARKAAVGPRAGSPAGLATVPRGKGEKVGETIRRAFSEARGSI